MKDLLVELTTTNSCNCKCRYCFELCKDNLPELSLDEEKRQITLLRNTRRDYREKGFDRMSLVFWGGEPLLNVDFMLKAVKATDDGSTRFVVYTNGTRKFETRRFVSGLTKSQICRLEMQFSYDGEPHNSTMRGHDGGTTLENARICKDAGVDVSFKATLSFGHLDMLPKCWDSYEDLYSRFGDCVSYSPTLDTTSPGTDDLALWKEVLMETAKREYVFYRKHKRFLMSWFNPDRRRYCRTRGTVHVQPDGKMYLCHACPYIEDMERTVLGTTKNIGSFTEVVSERPEPGPNPECLKCTATHCTVCHASLLKKGEDPFEKWTECATRAPVRCEYYRMFGDIDRALKFALLDWKTTK